MSVPDTKNSTRTIAFSYPGGKARLASWLCELFPPSGKRFIDLFAGRGNITFRAMQLLAYSSFWINDIRTSEFFTTLRDHTIEVPERSRAEYERQRDAARSGGTPESILLEPYLTFSGGGYSFAGSKGGGAYGNYRQGVSRDGYQTKLGAAHDLLNVKDVRITGLDYKAVLSELGEDDFVYFDAPYIGRDVRTYKPTDIDHRELVDILLTAKFDWALSEYRNPLYLSAFADPCWSQERGITYKRGKSGVPQFGEECLWTSLDVAHA